jgi:type I restriction enzyme M protein
MADKINLIKKLGFIPKENTSGIYHKKYSNCNDYSVEIDFDKNKIDYGKLIKSESKTTQNFSQEENWVILECVNRLLGKGYQPQNITLEKTWSTGHGTSGRLDILVTRDNGTAYLMIECKTWGVEFGREFNKLKKNGGQLFTYFQQDKDADVLMLYASELDKNKVQYRNEIIKIEDDYRQAGNVKDFFECWNKLPKTNGIFDSWVPLYGFQSKALTPKSLKEIEQKDSSFIFNRFLEILRHNVVSDKGNAFNKIFTLFLCKIYDEKITKPGEELGFQWKENIDNNISFQKRLTDLYREGMREFLEKDVVDLSDRDFENKYGSLSEKIKKEILEEFTKIRLKKNNEFAIKEVFDDDSFEENAKVVKEVVELLQKYKIRYTKKQQYLSDFFELLLTTGLKQESGQFFTPVPIAQFVIKSLPIDKMVIDKLHKSLRGDLLPTIIDYASGSGHFITESMHEVQQIIDGVNSDDFIADTKRQIEAWKIQHFDWAFDYVYGIEKDYRLVKVGKVGCYLHGDGLAKIVHSDGLGNFKNTKEYKGKLNYIDKDFQQENKQFDIVISNPPYSVSAFKNNARKYYTDKDFELYKFLTEQSSEIECLFIERTKQLLKDGGIAGIILPSSILSNTGIYTQTREIIFKYFDIIAIAELGSNTFMATGTNTVVLFLRRRNNYTVKNITESINRFTTNFQDITINGIEKSVSKYIAHVWKNISFEDYVSLINKQPNDDIREHEIYQEYLKNIKAKTEQEIWNKIIKLEQDKLLYFILAYPQKIVLAKTGEKQSEKVFLGYEFSNRRGSEGIHPIQRGKTIDECTSLFAPDVFDNPEKASTYIYKAFQGDLNFEIDEGLQKNISRIDLTEMMTFDRVDFEKTISLNVKKKVKIESKWDLVKVGDLVEILDNKRIPLSKRDRIVGKYPYYGATGVIDYINKYIFDEKLILIGEDGAKWSANANSAFIVDGKYWVNNHAHVLKPDRTKLLDKYFVELLNKFDLSEYITGLNVPKLNQNNLKLIKIPLPPREMQEKIVSEIDVLEEKGKEAKEKIVILSNKLKSTFNNTNNEDNFKFSNVATLEYGKPLHRNQRIEGIYSVMGSNGKVGTHSEFLIKGPAIIIGRKGSAGKIAFVEEDCFPIDTTFWVKYDKSKTLIKFFYYLLKELNLENIAKGKGVGVPGLNRNNVHNLKISLPILKEQKQIVAEIERIESKIKKLENEIKAIPEQKELIMKKYLE